MEMLRSVDDVIKKLGGVGEVAMLFSIERDAVYVWRKSKKFPAHTYKLLRDTLLARGFVAPITLWRMTEPAEAAE